MTTYKYTDTTNTIVHIIDEDGVSRSSCLAEILPADAVIEPADVPTPPTIAQQLAKLDAENELTQRNLREFIMLTSEALKAATGGAVDMSVLPGVAKVYTVEGEATELRTQL
jgi:hypothetical protein